MSKPTSPDQAPRFGFVSLGCPKALVDSERILTRLRSEGYGIAPVAATSPTSHRPGYDLSTCLLRQDWSAHA